MSYKAVPNYEIECDTCGAKPTVTMKNTEDEFDVQETEVCGPCFFGESEAIDSETWSL